MGLSSPFLRLGVNPRRVLYIRSMTALFWIFGLMNIANGLWMIASPVSWYHDLPAGVPDTGPLNLHFVRDIGAAFITLGVAFCAAAPRARKHRDVVILAGMFLVLHALIHVADLIAGRLPAEHWAIDLPGVFVPAMLIVVLALPRWWREEAVG
jgi:hypothetical protein